MKIQDLFWFLKILVLAAIASANEELDVNGTETCVHGNGQPGTCPAETCCRQELCKKRQIKVVICCEKPGRRCSNCPACIDCEWSKWTECIVECSEDNSNLNRIEGVRYRRQDPPRGPGGRHCQNEAVTSEVCWGTCKVNTDEKERTSSIATFLIWVYLVNTVFVAIYTYFDWHDRKKQDEGLRLRQCYWFGLILLAFIVPIVSGFYMLAYKWVHDKYSRAIRELPNIIDVQIGQKTFRLPLKNATLDATFRLDSCIEINEYCYEWKVTDNQTRKTTELGKYPELNSSQIILDQLPNISFEEGFYTFSVFVKSKHPEPNGSQGSSSATIQIFKESVLETKASLTVEKHDGIKVGDKLWADEDDKIETLPKDLRGTTLFRLPTKTITDPSSFKIITSSPSDIFIACNDCDAFKTDRGTQWTEVQNGKLAYQDDSSGYTEKLIIWQHNTGDSKWTPLPLIKGDEPVAIFLMESNLENQFHPSEQRIHIDDTLDTSSTPLVGTFEVVSDEARST